MIMIFCKPMMKTKTIFFLVCTMRTSDKAIIFALIDRTETRKFSETIFNRMFKWFRLFRNNFGFKKRVLPHVNKSRCAKLIMNERVLLKFTVAFGHCKFNIVKKNVMVNLFDECFPWPKTKTIQRLPVFCSSNWYC